MNEKHFYVTIEVKAMVRGKVDKYELRRRILQYIHKDNQKKNHANASIYVHGENTLSIYDEKGNEV